MITTVVCAAALCGGAAVVLLRVRVVRGRAPVGGAAAPRGVDAARRILDRAGLNAVPVLSTRAPGADHYCARDRRVVLSPETYCGTSPAALAVAAHEAVHAVQHFSGPLIAAHRWARAVRDGSALCVLPLLCVAAAADAAAAAFAALLLWGASVKAGATVALLERATSDGALDRLRDAWFLRSAADAEDARRVLRRLEQSYWWRALTSPLEVYADWSARDEEPAQGLRRDPYFRRFRKELFMTGSIAFVGIVVAIRFFGRDQDAEVAAALRVIDEAVDARR
jgi:Zn-dependent membrane protease YugP